MYLFLSSKFSKCLPLLSMAVSWIIIFLVLSVNHIFQRSLTNNVYANICAQLQLEKNKRIKSVELRTMCIKVTVTKG